MATNPIEKYRPVLSSSQILHICKLARADASEESLSVLGVMALYAYKISQGIIEPAYAESPRKSLEESLGFDTDSHILQDNQSPEALYQKWLISPEGLSIQELRTVQFYRYHNGKMMPEEERKYEAETLGV